jgi:peptidoglycan/xylan/chitin deacetylase (PgdA/CDA1 family)
MTPVAVAANGMRALSVALKGKGPLTLVRRAEAIGARYGVGPGRMDRRLAAIVETMEPYGWRATLPVTGAAVERHPTVIARYAALGIEFAVHGYYHVDHTGLSEAEQRDHFVRARQLLEANGAPVAGFRAPYLRWDRATLDAVRESGFVYDSSQAMYWPVDPRLETAPYRRALAFYGAVPATDHPVLPRLIGGVVQIPYCLPDDEAVVDRLRLSTPEAIGEVWLAILRATHERGELFTLGLHPERVEACGPAVVAVLEAARAVQPAMWVARLEEIARWWRARTATTVAVAAGGSGDLHVSIRGPRGLTVLARGVEVVGAEPWRDGYVRTPGTEFEIRAERRPFIGVHPSSASSLTTFLREQGYIVEFAESGSAHACFLERGRFSREDERSLLADLEEGEFPRMRLGRWPDGAHSALAVTGDVDALTIWDYASRFLGR